MTGLTEPSHLQAQGDHRGWYSTGAHMRRGPLCKVHTNGSNLNGEVPSRLQVDRQYLHSWHFGATPFTANAEAGLHFIRVGPNSRTRETNGFAMLSTGP